MFSFSARLHSYTGVWGRIRSSVQSPPDPSRKLPTAYTHFPPGLLYGSLKNWEVLGTGPNIGDTPSSPCSCSRLGKTRKDTSFKERKKKTQRKKQRVPPSIIAQQWGWSLDQRKGGVGAGGNLIHRSIGWSEEDLHLQQPRISSRLGFGLLPDSL